MLRAKNMLQIAAFVTVLCVLSACASTMKNATPDEMMDDSYEKWLIFTANPLSPKFSKTVGCSQWIQDAAETRWRRKSVDATNVGQLTSQELILEVAQVAYRCELNKARGKVLLKEVERRKAMSFRDVQYLTPESPLFNKVEGVSELTVRTILDVEPQEVRVIISGRTYDRLRYTRKYVCRDDIFVADGVVAGRSTDYCGMVYPPDMTQESGIHE